MEDGISSTCSSSPSPSSPPNSTNLPPFFDRFKDIPEPVRTDMINASLNVMSQHINLIAGRIIERGLDDPCSTCIEELVSVVMMADNVGLDVEKYKPVLAELRCLKREREAEREEKFEVKRRRACRVWEYDFSKEEEKEEESVIEIYD